MTIAAAGTSLLELATSVFAAYKMNPEIAVGNAVGSNIFKVFFILGVSSITSSLTSNARNNTDIVVSTIGGPLLFLWMFTGKKRVPDRREGIVFVVLYAGYISIFLPLLCEHEYYDGRKLHKRTLKICHDRASHSGAGR